MGSRSGTLVAAALNALRPTLTSLDLRFNGFYSFTSQEFVALFSKLPRGLLFLNLAGNNIYDTPSAKSELAEAFRQLPPNLKALNLTYNSLEKFNKALVDASLACLISDRVSLDVITDVAQNQLYEISRTNDIIPMATQLPSPLSKLVLEFVYANNPNFLFWES